MINIASAKYAITKKAKNKRPVGEEYVKKAAQHRAAARLARVVPYDLDKNEKLDPMARHKAGCCRSEC